jgi:glycosyltransferase involved in cell wall biosynthesis
MVAAAAWLAGVPATYVSVQGSPLRNRSVRLKSAVLAHAGRPFCAGEITASETIRSELIDGLRLPSRRITVIPNACAADEIRRRAEAARRGRPVRDALRILMVSRMDDAKDHPTLLRAVRILADSGVAARLALAGDGPRRAEHEALAGQLGLAGAVEFLGARTDVPELLGASDLLVHSSHTEAFAVVLVEAMAAGVPIVCSDIPSCREVLDKGRCGMLTPPQRPDLLADAIRRLLEDRPLAGVIAARAAERVRLHYDAGLIVARYGELLARA